LFVLALMIIALLAFGWLRPTLGDGWLRPLEEAASRFAKNKRAAILSIGLAAILARLAVLPVQPIPVPAVHDEFSNLLAADTYAHGRLTNPPHPMWIFFDTFHVLQHPTYASKYPPAPGMVLALGELLGHPWIGTLLSVGVMCMAITWMLQGWVPAPWALLGGILAVLRLGVFSWFDNYFGAPIGAIGGALVLGAYPRLIHSARRRDALVLGVGAVILLLSRPFEGFIFCLPVAVALALQFILPRSRWTFIEASRILGPAVGVLGLGLLFFGYYDWRVTGHPLLVPYVLYHREYFNNYPIFVWQKMPAPLHYSNPQFEAFFNGWNRTLYHLSWSDWSRRFFLNVEVWWYVFLGQPLTLALLGVRRMVTDRRMRLPLIQFSLCAVGLLSVVWFQPNYIAPSCAILFVLVIQAMRHLRKFTCSAKPVGIYLTRLVVVLMLDWTVILAVHDGGHKSPAWSLDRARIVRQLQATPGKHLVLVEYAPSHHPLQEWVYNAADIDHSRIVWARVIPGRDLTPLLTYFKDRQVWILHPDDSPPRPERACTAAAQPVPGPCANP
jgi:hypothetical protein